MASAGMRQQVVSSAARASNPVGSPDIIEAWPNSSPGPSRSSTRPSWMISTEPAADHPEVLDRPGALREDRLPRGEGLDLGHGRDAGQLVRRPPRRTAGASRGNRRCPPSGRAQAGSPAVPTADGRGTRAVLGEDRGRAAAQREQVVDRPDAAEQADEHERAPLVVPVVAAVDRRPRPGQVDQDEHLEDHGQHVHQQPPAAQREVRAVLGRRPLAAHAGRSAAAR